MIPTFTTTSRFAAITVGVSIMIMSLGGAAAAVTSPDQATTEFNEAETETLQNLSQTIERDWLENVIISQTKMDFYFAQSGIALQRLFHFPVILWEVIGLTALIGGLGGSFHVEIRKIIRWWKYDR